MVDPPHIDARLRQDLGSVIIAWAKVDAMLAELLSFMLRADPGAMYVLNQDVSANTQLNWLRTLCKKGYVREPRIQEKLTLLFDRIAKVREKRNVLVHGLWINGPERGTAFIHTVKLSRTEVVRFEPITRASLYDLYAEIEAVADELHEIGKAIGIIG